jgi:hypothetical protein
VPRRTDFSCCNDHKEHDHQQSLGSLAGNTKVGGCEWTFSLLQDYMGEKKYSRRELDIFPVEGSTWLKFGPASGVW